jgi:exopolysaccharide production protein ExoQ
MKTAIQSDPAGPFEKMFVGSALLLSTGAFMCLSVARGQGQDSSASDTQLQVVWVAIYFIAIVLLLWKCKAELKQTGRQYLLIALPLFALASTAWSDDPGVSLRRSIALILTCLFGVYLGSRFSLREQLRLLVYVCVISTVFSLVFGILGLGNPVEDIPNAWYGIFVHKNVLGRMMVLSIVIFVISARVEVENKSRYWFAAGCALALLLLSRSTTSAGVLAAMLAFLFITPVLRRPLSGLIKGGIAILVVFGSGVYWASQNLVYVLGLFGKDLTLTGRLQLWILSTIMALQTPWLGHGYSAFWLGPGSASERILAVVQWDAPHAHNGLLELWLEIGLVGVALFLLGFILYVGRAIAFFRRSRSAENVWPLCFLFFMFISNLTESDFLSRNTIFWILYVAVVISLRPAEEMSKQLVPTKSKPRLMSANPRVCEG